MVGGRELQMRALWQAPVAVQLDDVVRLKRGAQAPVEAARTEAEMRGSGCARN